MRITLHWKPDDAVPNVGYDIAKAGGLLAWAGFGGGERRIGVDVEDRAMFETRFRETDAGMMLRGVSYGDVNTTRAYSSALDALRA